MSRRRLRNWTVLDGVGRRATVTYLVCLRLPKKDSHPQCMPRRKELRSCCGGGRSCPSTRLPNDAKISPSPSKINNNSTRIFISSFSNALSLLPANKHTHLIKIEKPLHFPSNRICTKGPPFCVARKRGGRVKELCTIYSSWNPICPYLLISSKRKPALIVGSQAMRLPLSGSAVIFPN